MKLTTAARAGLCLITISVNGPVLADCPSSMPQQLHEDCIVYEGAGSNFPTSDYAYMDVYNAWLKGQQEKAAKNRRVEISSVEEKAD